MKIEKDANCVSCFFFKGNEFGGQCRKLPPTQVNTNAYQAFPSVSAEDWCGSYETSDEFKIITKTDQTFIQKATEHVAHVMPFFKMAK